MAKTHNRTTHSPVQSPRIKTDEAMESNFALTPSAPRRTQIPPRVLDDLPNG